MGTPLNGTTGLILPLRGLNHNSPQQLKSPALLITFITQRAFCEQHGLSLSTFFATRRQLQSTTQSAPVGFVRAEVVEKTTKYKAQIATANMTLLFNEVELSIPASHLSSRTHRYAIMKRMLSAPEIYLYRDSVDFRKSINGLVAIIESETDLPLGSGALFLFTNKQRDKINLFVKSEYTIQSILTLIRSPNSV